MIIKYLNVEQTNILINGTESASLGAPGDWASIGNGPTREAVLAWIAGGGVPEVADPLPNPRIGEIHTRLSQIDAERIRPMSAIVAGTSTAFDTNKLAALETEAQALRDELGLL